MPRVQKRPPRPRKVTPKRPRVTGKPTGRPDGLTDEKARALIGAVRTGAPLHTCTAAAGISDETLRKWRRRGEEALAIAAGRRNPTDRRYADFVARFDRALGEANLRAQALVFALMTVDPAAETTSVEDKRIALRAAEFHLTHRDAEHYRTASRAEVTGRDGGPVDVEVSGERVWSMLREIGVVAEAG